MFSLINLLLDFYSFICLENLNAIQPDDISYDIKKTNWAPIFQNLFR